MKKLIAGITLLALVISSFSACALTEESELPAESQELEGYWRYSPQCIWGDIFVAGEYIFGNGLEGQYISTYNLQTRGQKRIKEIPVDYRFEEPSIYKDKVVWSPVCAILHSGILLISTGLQLMIRFYGAEQIISMASQPASEAYLGQNEELRKQATDYVNKLMGLDRPFVPDLWPFDNESL